MFSAFASFLTVLKSIVTVHHGPARLTITQPQPARNAAANPVALTPASVQIMERVEKLEAKVVKLESGPSTPAQNISFTPELTGEAEKRVKELEDELAEARKVMFVLNHWIQNFD